MDSGLDGYWVSTANLTCFLRGRRPRFGAGDGRRTSVLALFSGLVPGGRQTHTDLLNCRPITWPRFRTSPAHAGRLDCLHSLNKKTSSGYYTAVMKFRTALVPALTRNPNPNLNLNPPGLW